MLGAGQRRDDAPVHADLEAHEPGLRRVVARRPRVPLRVAEAVDVAVLHGPESNRLLMERPPPDAIARARSLVEHVVPANQEGERRLVVARRLVGRRVVPARRDAAPGEQREDDRGARAADGADPRHDRTTRLARGRIPRAALPRASAHEPRPRHLARIDEAAPTPALAEQPGSRRYRQRLLPRPVAGSLAPSRRTPRPKSTDRRSLPRTRPARPPPCRCRFKST